MRRLLVTTVVALLVVAASGADALARSRSLERPTAPAQAFGDPFDVNDAIQAGRIIPLAFRQALPQCQSSSTRSSSDAK